MVDLATDVASTAQQSATLEQMLVDIPTYACESTSPS